MFSPIEPNIKLGKIIVFNRFLSLTFVINLLLYTFQMNFRENALANCLIVVCWLSIITYAVINEVTGKLVKKSMIATPEVCYVLSQVNAVMTALLITIVTFCTGNTDFMVMYLIPVFTSLFSSNLKLSYVLFSLGITFLLILDVTGWLKSQLLIINHNIFTSSAISHGSAMGLILYLGIIYSGYIRHNTEKTHKLHNLATKDALTGLINRREFNKRISEEISRAKRHNSPLSLAVFDIDFFKRINDTYGHNNGDAVLREIGEIIQINTRDCDIAARCGGEEFALILPETGLDKAHELLERLRLMIEVHYFNLSSTPIQTSISIGIGQLDFMDASFEDFYERVDNALYQAKRNGRNRVERASFTMPKLDLSKVLTSSHN